MTNQLLTARELLDRGLSDISPHLRAFDLSPDEDDPRREVLAGPQLVTSIREIALQADRGHLGSLIDELVAAGTLQSIAAAMINAKYQELGGASGLLGATAGAVTACPDGVGWFRHFQRGSIYWTSHTGAHEVHGAIRDRWAELGWERSFLGYPTTDETVGRDPGGVGRFNHFEHGSLYWHPPEETLATLRATTASTVANTMLTARATTTAAASGERTLGRLERAVNVNAIATERIEASPQIESIGRTTGVRPELRPEIVENLPRQQSVFEVHGAIRARYLALGAEASVLGYPTTDETATADGIGRFNHFQAGSIYWTPATGAHEVHGLIHQLWTAGGAERDPSLGYPITDELIPDRRVGSRRPESLRKPVIGLAADVVKLPSTAIVGGAASSVVNLPQALDVTRLDAASRTGLVESGVVTHIGGRLGAIAVAGGDSAPASEPSPNRFSDFEHGVAFWERGATAARRLTPWRQGGGSGPTVPLSEVLQAATNRLRSALASGTPGFQSATFAGTTGYRHDGSGTHNRAHRLTVRLNSGAMVNVEVTVAFDPFDRAATLAITHWAPQSGVSADLARSLHSALDRFLWNTTTLLDLGSTGGDGPSAVLSVKTLSSGDVAVYVEPPPSRLGPIVTDMVRTPLIIGSVVSPLNPNP